MNREQNLREIREARTAGQRALYSLENARRLLQSAGIWGWMDMFGGGFFSGMMKHSKMNDAIRKVQSVLNNLNQWEAELQ